MNNNHWRERYLESLKEELSIKDIMKLRNTSTKGALDIRRDAINYMIERDPKYIPPKIKVPTEAVFAVTGHNQKYYYDKMVAERKANF